MFMSKKEKQELYDLRGRFATDTMVLRNLRSDVDKLANQIRENSNKIDMIMQYLDVEVRHPNCEPYLVEKGFDYEVLK